MKNNWQKYFLTIVFFIAQNGMAETNVVETDNTIFSYVKSLPEKGSFKQQRKLKIIRKPFISSGFFEIQAESLIWHTQKPFDVKYQISSEEIKETVDGHETVQKLESNPHMATFAQVFSSLFKLDLAVLEENFEMTFIVDEGSWSLILMPNKEPINKIFQSIVVTGEDTIRTIQTNTLSGDSNLINLRYES